MGILLGKRIYHIINFVNTPSDKQREIEKEEAAWRTSWEILSKTTKGSDVDYAIEAQSEALRIKEQWLEEED